MFPEVGGAGDVAEVFMSGRSQAVRLPKAYRFGCKEVEVTREGDAVVLRPRRAEPWANLKAAVFDFGPGSYEENFGGGREQPEEQERLELDAAFRE